MRADQDMHTDRQRLEELKAEIAGRVRRFCPLFPEADFRALVDDMARIHHKYEQRLASTRGMVTPAAREPLPRPGDARGS